jgi:hypothetical protein
MFKNPVPDEWWVMLAKQTATFAEKATRWISSYPMSITLAWLGNAKTLYRVDEENEKPF